MSAVTDVPPPPPPPRRTQYVALVNQIIRARRELAAAQTRYELVRDRGRTQLPRGRYFGTDGEVLITRDRFWDRAKALLDYGAAICSMTVDQKLAREHMTGRQYETYFVDRPNKVIVRGLDGE